MAHETALYFSLWTKYKAPIIQLMRASASGPQQYKLSGHEFIARGEKTKSGYSFLLEAFNGKAQNNISASAVAKDLLSVLQQSPVALQLMSEASFEIRLDKQYNLHISRKVIDEVS